CASWASNPTSCGTKDEHGSPPPSPHRSGVAATFRSPWRCAAAPKRAWDEPRSPDLQVAATTSARSRQRFDELRGAVGAVGAGGNLSRGAARAVGDGRIAQHRTQALCKRLGVGRIAAQPATEPSLVNASGRVELIEGERRDEARPPGAQRFRAGTEP